MLHTFWILQDDTVKWMESLEHALCLTVIVLCTIGLLNSDFLLFQLMSVKVVSLLLRFNQLLYVKNQLQTPSYKENKPLSLWCIVIFWVKDTETLLPDDHWYIMVLIWKLFHLLEYLYHCFFIWINLLQIIKFVLGGN